MPSCELLWLCKDTKSQSSEAFDKQGLHFSRLNLKRETFTVTLHIPPFDVTEFTPVLTPEMIVSAAHHYPLNKSLSYRPLWFWMTPDSLAATRVKVKHTLSQSQESLPRDSVEYVCNHGEINPADLARVECFCPRSHICLQSNDVKLTLSTDDLPWVTPMRSSAVPLRLTSVLLLTPATMIFDVPAAAKTADFILPLTNISAVLRVD